MKIHPTIQRTPTCLAAVVLLAVAAATTVRAASSGPPALQGQITLRPLTPSDIKDYGLTGVQGASGLTTVGVGQPAYLEVLVNSAIPVSGITNVTWVLTNKPVGSAAVLAPSPLGTNVPTYKMADRFNNSGAPVYQVAGPVGRMLLRPDVVGQYTVVVTVATAANGSTNLTQNITAGKYMGIDTCALCHSGGIVAEDKYHSWSQTPHATFFTRQIDGGADPATSHYGKNCISCHTVGYDANTNAVNDGFDDIAKQLGWTFPTNLLTGTNWSSLPDPLKNLANIQCENCHGPGSEHAALLGHTNALNWPRISVTFAAGDCAQCHDSKPNHVKSAEWNNSLHARVTRTPSGPTRTQCVRCHTAPGIASYLDTGSLFGSNTVYEAITCQACHDPHDASNPHQLRASESVLLADGVTVVTNAGAGTICMNCHRSRNGSVSNSIANWPLGQTTWAGGSSFGPHDNPASDMLEGVNGWTYGKAIPSSAHAMSVTDTCAGCHMQIVATNSPAYTAAKYQAGGHTWNMTYPVFTGGVTNSVDLVDVCVKCHGPMTSFDMKKIDYNGDGIIEGVQTEVQHLLDKLSTLLPSSTYVASGNYAADGLVKSSISAKTNWPSQFLKAGYNWQFVNNDLSKGVHNAAYAVGLLKASIGDLTGDVNNDGLSDAWQVQYFGPGFATNALAGQYGVNNTNGIPNWMMYAMGLAPSSGLKAGDGVIYISDGNIVNGATNAVAIYTAAEIAFDTVVGTSYQIQGITALSGTWQNIGTNIVGTGTSVRYLTPTRGTDQMFFRVVHTP